MRNVVIAGYGRTPFSRARPKDPEKDPLSGLSGEELLAAIVPQLLDAAKVAKDELDDFIVGCALGVGEQWTFGGRTTSLLCGLPPSVPARSVDMQCGSGMAALQTGYLEIASGQADIVMVGGFEQMTRVPVGPTLFDKGCVSVNPKLLRRNSDWDMFTGLNMGLSAELLAERQGFSRSELDRFAVTSHHRAAVAHDNGVFRGEIIPVTGADGTVLLESDQSIRPETNSEELAQLKSVFKSNGVITAGNSSPLNAGAAAMILMSEEFAHSRGVKPSARILATGLAGVRPELMGIGPVPATHKALRLVDKTVGDIALWEINEAFSVVVLHAARELGLSPEQINIHGGALAIGHPLGATGLRLVGTLARSLDSGQYGCASACVGGGQGIATIIEGCG